MANDGLVRADDGWREKEVEGAYARLRESEELYRHVVELSNLIPWVANSAGQIVAVGTGWSEWTGRPVSEALAEGWRNIVHPDDLDDAVTTWRAAIASGEPYEGEWRIRTKANGYRWCHARAARRTDGSRSDQVWYGTLEDVDERRLESERFRRAEAKLANVSRLSAMGAMATAIAHDLNQPLTAIVHYLRGSKRLLNQVEGEGRAALAAALDNADKSAVRASDIVRRVREFVTRGTIDAHREQLKVLIDDACRLALIDAAERGIHAHISFDADCYVIADRIQVQQVLVNLIRNAVEAMDSRPRRQLEIRASGAKPGFCQVAVQDTGMGIAPEEVPRLFDPLYTTRKDGMGVGLPICRMIVEAHGGSIWYEPAPGGGAIIFFTLPLAPRL